MINDHIKLTTNSTLTSLNLNRNDIHNIGGEYIAKALYFNSSLTFIDLTDNYISDTGIYHIARALGNKQPDKLGDIYLANVNGKVPQINSSLMHLILKDNTICNAGINSIIEVSIKYSTFVEYSKDFI